MQFDYFDKKVKVAADHHHPAYNAEAWSKMQKLLNKHLPEKEDRRRRFLLLILLLAIVVGAGLFIAEPWGKKNITVTAKAPSPLQLKTEKTLLDTTVFNNTVNSKTNHVDIANVNSTKVTKGTSTIKSIANTHLLEVNYPVSTANKANERNSRDNILKPNSSVINKKSISETTSAKVENKDKKNLEQTGKTDGNEMSETQTEINKSISNKMVNDKAAPVSDVAKENAAAKESNPVKNGTTGISKKENKKKSTFLITASIGPDLSFVGNNKSGAIKLLAGAGLGFAFNEKFIVRTGFYSARKVYTASANAYNPPPNFYTYYPYLEKVEANCRVYEIPVTFSYNFSRAKKYDFLASVSVSSYIMKEEKYNYFYKTTPSGSLYNSTQTISNKNKHLFSSLTLATGYQRKIGQHISILAEPYIKLPLSGVGYGKVKLNSAGVLFSVSFNPFVQKK